MTHDDDVAKVAELIKDARIAMLTTVGADGSLVSRPMGVQDVDFDGDLWFFADDDSHKVHEIEARQPRERGIRGLDRLGLGLRVGRGGPRPSPRSRSCGARRPTRGSRTAPRPPAWCSSCCAARRRSTGTRPAASLTTAFSLVKAKVTGERYDGGENETVAALSVTSTRRGSPAAR